MMAAKILLRLTIITRKTNLFICSHSFSSSAHFKLSNIISIPHKVKVSISYNSYTLYFAFLLITTIIIRSNACER